LLLFHRSGFAMGHRFFGTSSKFSKLPPAKFQPFAISREEAASLFQRWTRENSLGAVLRTTAHRQVYAPFFAYSIQTSTVYSANVGKMVTRWRLKGMLPQRTTELEWTQVSSAKVSTSYSRDSERMQVFASNEFKLPLVSVAHGPLLNLKCFQELSPDDLEDKEWFPFTVKRHVAREEVFSYVRDQELRRGPSVLSKQFDSYKIRDLEATVSFDFINQPVYLPVFIFEFDRFGRQFRCFMNGVTGQIFGQKHFSFPKVVASVSSPIAALVAGVCALGINVPVLPAVAVALVPGVVAGAFRALYPLYLQQQREKSRLQRRSRFQQQADKHSKAYQGSSDTAITKQHYHTLGVKNTASVEEIKTAFRKLSFKHHPDVHHNDPAAAKRAAEEFKNILKAYKTLRDPVKRKRYDLSNSSGDSA